MTASFKGRHELMKARLYDSVEVHLREVSNLRNQIRIFEFDEEKVLDEEADQTYAPANRYRKVQLKAGEKLCTAPFGSN